MNSVVRVRRTAIGNFSVKLTFPTSVALDDKLMTYLFRDIDPRFLSIKTVSDITHNLFYSVLLTFHQRVHFRLITKRTSLVMEQVSFCMSRPQALAVIWFLREAEYSEFIELKAALLRAL